MKYLVWSILFLFGCCIKAVAYTPEIDSSEDYSIQLINMSAISTPIAVHLKWEISYEEDGALFIIEKSIDGYSWVEKSKRKSVGNHDTYQVYLESISNFPEAAIEYFRLKRIDINGVERILDVTVVQHELLSELKIYADNEDIFGTVTLTFESLETGRAMVSVTDISGRVHQFKRHDLSIGYNRKTLSFHGMQEGVYLVSVEDRFGNRISKRWIIHKSKGRKR